MLAADCLLKGWHPGLGGTSTTNTQLVAAIAVSACDGDWSVQYESPHSCAACLLVIIALLVTGPVASEKPSRYLIDRRVDAGASHLSPRLGHSSYLRNAPFVNISWHRLARLLPTVGDFVIIQWTTC
uniref:Uncharacterized protein n=1 Tax=Trichuris muris TaxID=70415 RepID=A0A5S6R571_TRIMR